MTTKEIAEAVGKKEGAIRNWVRKLASKNDAVASKNDADYTLKGVCYGL